MPNQRGLGRGFDSLIPTELIDQEFDTTAQTSGGEQIQQLDPGLIDPNPHQPRQIFDEKALAGLTESIKLHGILQPMVVTKEGSRYQLIAGERRLRAAKAAGLATVPAIVRSFNDQQKLELALIENLQRQELNPIETATAYRKLIDQFSLSLSQVAHKVGRDETTISNSMRLLRLPLEAKRAVATGKISEGHARQILAVPADRQQELLDLIIKHGWTVRQTEAFVRHYKAPAATKEKAAEKSASSNQLTRDLETYLGAKVALKPMAKGGRLQIEYSSDEELQRIYEAIKPKTS